MIGAYVTEMLTQHAELVDDVTINVSLWPVYAQGVSRERAAAYVEAFAERYGVEVHTVGGPSRDTVATEKNEALGDRSAVTTSIYGPRRPAAEV